MRARKPRPYMIWGNLIQRHHFNPPCVIPEPPLTAGQEGGNPEVVSRRWKFNIEILNASGGIFLPPNGQPLRAAPTV